MVGERLKRGLKPRELLGVARWADRFRELKSGTNAPGRWHTDLTPYLAEVMDSLSEHSEVRQVTFMKSAGVGATEAMYNWIGYVMHHLGNKDLLVVVPTLELRDRSFNPRLSKMIDETPVLAELVSKATRHKSNRGDLLEYGARARIIKAGANSPDSLRSDHLPYVICDEVDAFPWDVGGEGDDFRVIGFAEPFDDDRGVEPTGVSEDDFHGGTVVRNAFPRRKAKPPDPRRFRRRVSAGRTGPASSESPSARAAGSPPDRKSRSAGWRGPPR